MGRKTKQQREGKLRRAKQRRAKRKQQKIVRQSKQQTKIAKLLYVENMLGQFQEQSESTFDRAGFQTLDGSNNTQHGSVEDAVLGSQAPAEGFNKDAWTKSVNKPKSKPKSKSIKTTTGFDIEAWKPPDADSAK